MYENHFFRYLETEKRYSVLTLQSYIQDIHQFTDFVQNRNKGCEVEHVTMDDIRAWIVNLMDLGYKPSSVNRKISSLKSMFRFFQKNGYIAVNPMKKISGPKQAKSIPVFVEPKGMENLSQDIFPKSFHGLRDKLMIEILYQTGIRRAELLGIRINDIDRANLTLKITGKRNKQRIVPLSKDLVQLIDEYLVYRNEVAENSSEGSLLVLDNGKKLYAEKVYRIVKKYIGMVSAIEKQSPHVLRHTFATHMLNNGADLNAIKELLGHTSLAATQVYTHNTFEKLKQIYKQAHPRA